MAVRNPVTAPPVSIVIAAYNAADTITATLASCQQQTYSPLDIIVVDDGSTDDTVAVVQQYQQQHDANIRLIQQPNQGPGIARNRGIDAATSDFIQFCDSDDRLLPEKVARCMTVIQQHPDAALVYTQMQPVAADGETPLTDFPVHPPPPFFETTRPFCEILAYVGAPIQTSTILARKAALQDVGTYRNDPQHRCAEDWDLLLRLASKYDMIGIPEPLVRYRRHPDALTQNTYAMAYGRLQTAIYARDYDAREACMDDATYDAFLAGRWHVLAMAEWRRRDRSAARRAFAEAIALTPQGRRARRLLRALTYVAPAPVIDLIFY